MAPSLLDRKLEYWEHQLLDLGKRNRMINYRETKRSTLTLAEPPFEELYQRIAVNEETLTFQRPVDRETDIRVFSILSLLEHLSSPLPVTIGDIKTEGSILERQKTLQNMRSKARLSQEEQGTNILYLSFGFIEWRDGKGASAQKIRSPLILVPAVLALEALNSPYTLSRHEDDIVVNPTLQYYLKTEHGIEIPAFDSDRDTLEGYLAGLEDIADRQGWRIIREVSLGLLSFLKISMYNDLLRNEERIRHNPVIRAMAGETDAVNSIPDSLRTFDLDSVKPRDCYQVMSADSSQQDAILYSKNNISFVMQGPPGTGKSQTITNMIAEALADGKKVLFVSEKMAALQVVYRRLQEAHLADFCLPLHSYKANKKDILEQIGANLRLKQTRVKDTALSSLEELLAIRQELNRYAGELHQLNPELSLSCYEVYSKLEAVNDAPSVSFEFASPLDVTPARLQGCLNRLKEYELSLRRINGQTRCNPWEGLQTRMAGYEYAERMRQTMTALADKLTFLRQRMEAIRECPELPGQLTYARIPTLIEAINLICDLPKIPGSWLDAGSLPRLTAEAEDARSRYEKLSALENDIQSVCTPDIYGFDYREWRAKLAALAAEWMEMPFAHAGTADDLVENAAALQERLGRIGAALAQAVKAFASANALLGTGFVCNAANLNRISGLLALIHPNERLARHWFDADLAPFKTLLAEAKTNAERMRETKARILADWEADVFALDYAPVLLRYKTEYTGIFKVFSPQYRNDKKQLRGMTRTIVRKLTDDAACRLLLGLKEYHELEAWFEARRGELANAAASYFTGPETDWAAALSAIETTEKIRGLPADCVSPALRALLAEDHADAASSLEAWAAEAGAAFAQAREALAAGSIHMAIDAADFNAASALPQVKACEEKLCEVREQFRRLTPFLLREETMLATVDRALDSLNAHRALAESLDADREGFRLDYGPFFMDRQTRWDDVIALLHKAREIKALPMADALEPAATLDTPRKQAIRGIAEEAAGLHQSASGDFAWLCTQFSQASLNDGMNLCAVVDKLSGCLACMPMLDGWIDYQEARQDCCENGLADLIEKAEDEDLQTDMERIFLKGFYHLWLEAVLARTASVRRFRRNTHDERVKRFMELDDLQLLIAQMRIREKLIENLPANHQLLKATDEVAILQKELSKKRSIMPLRKLFRLIPSLLMKLKPCLMMSPLSVSYFLETEAYSFDLVIFDEASQIFPEDAIGAIFRGAQVIIAGDSKQLPPTSFFSATTNNAESDFDAGSDEDDMEVVSDSILEESASVLPNRTLLWHYRSKHESLIAFSNREIYQNNLITFPTSVTRAPDMGVEYIYVENGYYEGAGRNCNIREAQKCVMLVLDHIQKHPDRSLGIIAFSEKQQTAIENAITDFRERFPMYEWFFDDAKDEPFFVKNLENVQGDERDTIIFSICYAKDRNGKMYMRFGPLGHEGGERRLNVAITRAKCNVKLVGSILPSDIDLNRTNSEGVRMLRAYIEYARRGTEVLQPVKKAEAMAARDDFCKVIAAFLAEHGYRVQTDVGCSDYKIDIAVENPAAEGEYIAGIECDGLSYVHAKTARDRDHLRSSVLQNMGWNLYRVWSTEWMRNPAAEGEALLSYLRALVDQDGCVRHAVKSSHENTAAAAVAQIASETTRQVQQPSDGNPYGFAFYREANWWDAPDSASGDNLTRIGEMVRYIVSVEQPMHMELLYRRMGSAFSAGKATEGVRNTIDEAIAQTLTGQVSVDGDHFIRLAPHTPAEVRIPDRYDTPRPMEYIHTEEVAAAMLTIIRSTFGITIENLGTECAHVFGFERKGPKIRQKTDAAIQYLQSAGMIRVIDGKASVV